MWTEVIKWPSPDYSDSVDMLAKKVFMADRVMGKLIFENNRLFMQGP